MAAARTGSPGALAVSRLGIASPCRLGSGLLFASSRQVPTAARRMIVAASPTPIDLLILGFQLFEVPAVEESPELWETASRANAKSDDDWKRWSGFFSRQRWTTLCRAGGVFPAICEM